MAKHTVEEYKVKSEEYFKSRSAEELEQQLIYTLQNFLADHFPNANWKSEADVFRQLSTEVTELTEGTKYNKPLHEHYFDCKCILHR